MKTLLHRNPSVIVRELDGEIFILDERDKRIHHLNITASAIWRFLETPASVNQVLAVFRQIYPNEDQTMLKKLLRKSIAKMRTKDILHQRKR